MLTQSVDQFGESIFQDLFKRAKSAVSRWREVSQLGPREIELVSRDLSISPAELVTLMSTSSISLEQLNKRLAHEGLAEKALAVSDPDELRDMRRVCSQCRSKSRCARDIRHKRMATPSKYCPNELTLRSLACRVRNERSAKVVRFPVKPA
jgi:hypothetical protein